MKNGIVENIEFTSGGAGNQWTTISGIKYATYWDVMTKNWRVGDEVEFNVNLAPLWSGQPAVAHAYNIKKKD